MLNLPLNLFDPFVGGVVRSVRAARRVIEEERLPGVELVDAMEVGYGLVGHVGGEVVAWIAEVGIDAGGVAVEIRLPLIGLAAVETVEIVKAHADRPAVEGSSLARLEGWRVVVLAEPRGCIAILLENFANRSLVLGNDAVIARIAGGGLADHTKSHRVMVAPGDQRGAGRGAKRGGVKLRVAQAHAGDAIERRRRDDT